MYLGKSVTQAVHSNRLLERLVRDAILFLCIRRPFECRKNLLAPRDCKWKNVTKKSFYRPYVANLYVVAAVM
jgi:hypothetical protein